MAANKKPAKKYRPRPKLVNPIEYVQESHAILAEIEPSYVLDIKLKDHSAMERLVKGEAQQPHLENLIATWRLVYGAWATLGVPMPAKAEHAVVLLCANVALCDLCQRHKETGKAICKAVEINALNELVALNDNLLDVMTKLQFEKALTYATKPILSTEPLKKAVML